MAALLEQLRGARGASDITTLRAKSEPRLPGFHWPLETRRGRSISPEQLGAVKTALLAEAVLAVRREQRAEQLQAEQRGRQEVERLRQEVERLCGELEQQRRAAEQQREELAQQREELAQQRQELELQRREAEQQRQEAEQRRQEAERQRQEAEQQRQETERRREQQQSAGATSRAVDPAHHAGTLGSNLLHAEKVQKELAQTTGELRRQESTMREQLQRSGELVKRLQQATERASTLQQQLSHEAQADGGWITATGKRGAAQRKAAAAAAARPRDDAASRERGRMEAQQRERQRLDLRVVVKAGAKPQPDQARRALEALLQERLRMAEAERQRAMQHVKRVMALPGRRGAGYTLLVTFDGEEAKQLVYSRRHSWRGGGEGPALTIGHNLTPEQQELHGQLFPVMAGIFEQGVRVRMEYYPAVCVYVAGKQCHTAAEAEAAAAAYLRRRGTGADAGGAAAATAATGTGRRGGDGSGRISSGVGTAAGPSGGGRSSNDAAGAALGGGRLTRAAAAATAAAAAPQGAC